MEVRVSGASGLIGRALRPVLEAAGHQVVPLPRGELGPAALEGTDAVINLSGERIRAGRWTSSHKREVLESRVRTTRSLAETIAGMSDGPQIFLSASAIGIYGSRGDEELTEESALGDDFLAELCKAWEAATAEAENAGARVVHLRTGLVLDVESPLMKAFMPPGPFVAGRLGSGKQWMSWITTGDEVNAIRHLLEHDSASGPVNLTAPNPATNREFVRAVSTVTGKRTLPPVPAAAIKAVFGGEAARGTALASQRVLPTRLEATGYSFAQPDLEPGLRLVLSRS